MNKPMTRQKWLSYIEQTWDAAQKEAWSEQPRREWVGLTDEEIDEIGKPYQEKDRNIRAWGLFACAVTKKLKEKNT